MNPEWKQRHALAIGAMAEAYRQTITKATIKAYELGLDDLPIEAIETAVKRALQSSRFMPSVAELRELAGVLSPADRAIKAWDVFTRAISIHGCYASVNFDDPVINATIRNLGGWVPVLIQVEQEGATWVRKNFERVYKSLAATGISSSQALPLCGIHEKNNVGRTDWQPVVKMIETGLPPHGPGIVPAIGHERKERPAIEYAGDIGQLPETT